MSDTDATTQPTTTANLTESNKAHDAAAPKMAVVSAAEDAADAVAATSATSEPEPAPEVAAPPANGTAQQSVSPDATTTLNAALSNPRADMESIDALERELFALRYAQSEIMAIGLTIDPPKATEERAEALGALEEAYARTITSAAASEVIGRLSATPELLSDARNAQIRALVRDRKSLLDVPPKELAEFSRLACESNDVWCRAKAANDWASFEPYLDRLVAARKHMAEAKNPDADPYDVWLDENEIGRDRTFYDDFFAQVKDCVVPLLADCVASGRTLGTSCVEGNFNVARQWDLAHDLAKLEGLDEDALWIGKTEHPFTCSISQGFVTITGHAYRDNLLSNVFSILHEGGHALYEQNINPTYRYTSLSGGTSAGMHESQSRFFENLVGRSEAFAGPLLGLLRKNFPGRFNNVAAHQLFLAVNRVEPSLIRTEADELTYPLHIIVRYEIERLLFSGEAKASDVPGLWRDLYKSYLGVDVPDDTHGALQDTHWAAGNFGYFPTYALGNAIASQLKARMVGDGVDFEGACAAGDLAPIREWLRDRVWQWGRAKDTDEIILAACYEPFSATYYTDYLKAKFSSLYRL